MRERRMGKGAARRAGVGPVRRATFSASCPRVLHRFRAYGRVRSLHLERGEGLWPQNKKKDLSFEIDGAGVGPTVQPLL